MIPNKAIDASERASGVHQRVDITLRVELSPNQHHPILTAGRAISSLKNIERRESRSAIGIVYPHFYRWWRRPAVEGRKEALREHKEASNSAPLSAESYQSKNTARNDDAARRDARRSPYKRFMVSLPFLDACCDEMKADDVDPSIFRH